ncbi:MAG: NADH-quinone oxidoreductase subunit NuoH [Anaerolineales bacterium]|nr:NADH-quinone oxidoreductase subunit NuoH [Anaerolineales bacterium]
MSVWTDPIETWRAWLAARLLGVGLPAAAVDALLTALGAAGIVTGCLLFTIVLIWAERRLVARMQDRVGPNRTGPQGLLQPVADVLKLLTRELVTPTGADRWVYNLAPILAVTSVLAMWAVIPFAVNIVGADLNVGVIYVAGAGSLGTLAIMLAGWSSNNKYGLLGAFRAVAQLVSYEAPMLLSLAVPVLLARSMSLPAIVAAQEAAWFIVLAPIPALVFFITSVAEAGRAPFDLLEADSEIATGYSVEYGGMRFGLLMAAEFLHGFTVGALVAVLFLGGWQGPLAERYPLLGSLYFALKAFAGYFLVVLLRTALPRWRIDQMLDLCWKFLTPLALGALTATMIADKLAEQIGSGLGPRLLALWIANGLVAWAAVWLLARSARRLREAEEKAARLRHRRAPSVPVAITPAPPATAASKTALEQPGT